MRSGSAWLLMLVSLPLLAQVGPKPDQLPPLPEELRRVLATENTLTPAAAAAADVVPPVFAPQPPPPPPEHQLPVEQVEPVAAAAAVTTEPAAPAIAAELPLPPEGPASAAVESPAEPSAATVATPAADVQPEVPSASASAPALTSPSEVAVDVPAVAAVPSMPAAVVDDAAANAAAHVAAVATVDGFHQSLREGWKEGVLPYLAPDVVILEQGYLELSRDDYANGNLDSDLVFAASTRREVLQRKVEARGELVWVVTQARTSGLVGGQQVNLENAETMVVRRDAGQWRIVHIHWSAHSRDPD